MITELGKRCQEMARIEDSSCVFQVGASGGLRRLSVFASFKKESSSGHAVTNDDGMK